MTRPSYFTYKNIVALLIVLAMGCCVIWWLSGQDSSESARLPKDSSDKLQVVVSSYVPYTLAQSIGGEQVQLSMLVPPGAEPHHFEPTPGSIISVEQADVFLYTSLQAEPWVGSILSGLSDVNAVEIAAVEPTEDPHVWMTPYGALSMAQVISQALVKADPAHKSYYRKNLRQFEKQIEALHQDFASGLAHCKHKTIIHIGHLAFGPLAQTYGLELEALAGVTHQGEHSVRRLTQLVRRIRSKKAAAIFSEEMLPPDLARTVALETNVRVLPLYTVEEVGKEDFDQGVGYETYMRRNLKNLQEGLQCPA